MTSTIKLGRVLGVPVGLHWSVLGVVVLIVVLLSGWLPVELPGRSAVAYGVAALCAAALFLFSLLAHELTHAVVARRNGVDVDGITLWLLGGVARLRGEPETAGADFRIAFSGPVTSAVLAAVFAAAAWLADLATTSELTVVVLVYLAFINMVLAGFNLVPAAPLDGGRILRAAVWAWRGDRHVAATWAARAGRVFGVLLIVLGLVRMFTATGGLWWVLIGLFVVTMAGAEERQARVNALLADTRVRDVMTADPDVVLGDRTVADFLNDVALSRQHSAFPLVDDWGRVQGLVTLNRLRAVPPDRRSTTSLREVACKPADIPLAEPDELMPALLSRLDGCADGRALVMSEGRIVGIVSPSDISRAVTWSSMDAGPEGGGRRAQEVL